MEELILILTHNLKLHRAKRTSFFFSMMKRSKRLAHLVPHEIITPILTSPLAGGRNQV
jgi:hypothetical protein